jgi:hypothetical protein
VAVTQLDPRARARATGVDLATVLDEPRWASRLQADQLNPFAMVPARRMAQLLKTLRVGWTEGVRDAMYRLDRRGLQCVRRPRSAAQRL